MTLSPEEQGRRATHVAQVRHSTEMEGGRNSEEARADQDAWVRGEISADELVARAIAKTRAGEAPAPFPSA